MQVPGPGEGGEYGWTGAWEGSVGRRVRYMWVGTIEESKMNTTSCDEISLVFLLHLHTGNGQKTI